MKKQIESAGVRLGDSCNILPYNGKRKAFTLNRTCIDLISSKYRPHNLSMSYIELPNTDFEQFHYRLELDKGSDGRFVLRTIKGHPFWLNGSAAKEAYIERRDRLFIDENKVNFAPFGLDEHVVRSMEHPVLLEDNIISSELRILLEGETGTGKTRLARKIHEKSSRLGQFVAVNLSSFNPNLIESELFGHKKGAFTGAIKDKGGAFKAAEYGTLFLDEVDSLPLEIQTKLLCFLDDNKFRMVGDTQENEIRTRIIFASGRSLEDCVNQGLMRKDFFFRLKAGHTIILSPLRDEPQKIKEFCQHYALSNNVSFSQKLLDFYETLAWPGNLRQLVGHLDKKRILTKSVKLDFDDLDEELVCQSSDLLSFHEKTDLVSMKELKAQYVKQAMSLCEGNLSQVAKKLRLTPKTVKSLLEAS